MSTHENIKIYNLYRNFGHEITMGAGMDHAKGDCVIFAVDNCRHTTVSYLLFSTNRHNGSTLYKYCFNYDKNQTS